MTDERLAEIEVEFCPALGVTREPSYDVPALVAEVRRLRGELAQARAIIEGRPNPPTTAEKMAHRCDAAEGWDANGAPTR